MGLLRGGYGCLSQFFADIELALIYAAEYGTIKQTE